MKITDMAIDRRTTVFVLLFLIVAAGIFSMIVVPRESEPDIDIPMAIIAVSYEGVSPEDMETLVTVPIERKLTGIAGVKQIRSTCNEGMSTTVVEFDTDVDVDDAIQKVKDKVDLAKPDLPDDAEDAVVRGMNMSESPVIFANLTGAIGLQALTKTAEELEDKIESLPGILDVEIIGDVEREIQIEVDPVRAGLYGVSLADLVQITAAENVNTPAGSVDVGEGKYLMRVPGEIKGVEDIRDMVVRRGENGVVYMRDLADVRDGLKDSDSYSRLDGLSSVTIVATKRSGVNIIKVASDVKQVIEESRTTLPPGVDLKVTLDESERIRLMFRQLVNSILTGLILVMAITFLFLGFWNALFVALAIPLSMLITFVVMYFTGITFNMVTLFALMVSLGMLVDNGIVVVENIYRHAQMGYSRYEAAKRGTREVAWPVFGSALTTVVAFFPMVFWPGMMGKFLNFLPKTVIITLFASLFVGLIVNPALASKFVTVRRNAEGKNPFEAYPLLKIFLPIAWPLRFWRAFARATGGGVLTAYERVLRLALRWRAVSVVTAVTLLVAIVGSFAANGTYEFLTEIEPDRVFIDIEMPEGANLDSTDSVARDVERLLSSEQDKLDFMVASVGSKGPNIREGMPGASVDSNASHLARVTLVFPEWTERVEQPRAITHRVRGLFDNTVGAEIRLAEAGMGPPVGSPVNIELSGDDFDELAELTERIEKSIVNVNGLVDLHDDLDKGKPEVRVIIDRQQASLANLDTRYIGMTVQAAIHGRKAAEYREGDDEYDVVVRFPNRFSEDLSYVEGMSLVNREGRQIPFTAVARLEQGVGLGSIKRVDRKRTVTIIAEAEGRSGKEVLADVQEILAELPLPPGYAIAYTGENEESEKSAAFLVQAFAVALLLIALVLITQFNSIIQPAIIMSSVILSLAGVFAGLMVFRMPFGFLMTGIGCVSLSGIVVNNAIVLVDYVNQLRREGMPLEQAIVTAGKTRFRPVLLTAATTILGLLPLGLGISYDFADMRLVSGGEQASYWGSLAVAIIFGLTFATVLTLVVVPALYSISESVSEFFRKRGQEDTTDMPGADSVAK